MVKKIGLAILSLLLAHNFLFAVEPLQTRNAQLATDFRLLDSENKEFSLSDYKGKSIMLFFWTTWCPYCRKELKLLNTMHADLLKNGVEVVSINEDESTDKVPKFIKDYSLSYRVLLDKDHNVAAAYGVQGIPTYILIDKESRIVFSGWSFPQEYKDLISK